MRMDIFLRRFIVCVACLAVLLPAAASAGVRITEVMYDADGTDTKREWVEIFNEGPDAANLSDWKFIDKSSHVLNVPPKNGGLGSMMLAPGRYAILAADAAVFSEMYPGISIVIDTTMSLNNAGGKIALRNTTSVVDSMAYAQSQGASDDGDSLQLSDGVWIHALPTPGRANATTPSVHAAPSAVAPTKTIAQPKVAKPKAALSVAAAQTHTDIANDPLAIVNATTTDPVLAETAAAGVLGGTMWWFAAAALALGTGAVVSVISRTKKNEWDIEESE